MSNSLETPWTPAHQASSVHGISRQEYWSGLPFPSSGDLPVLGIELTSPTLAEGFFTTESPGKSNIQGETTDKTKSMNC